MIFKLYTIQHKDYFDIYMKLDNSFAFSSISLVNKYTLESLRNELHAKIDYLINKHIEHRGPDGKQTRNN